MSAQALQAALSLRNCGLSVLPIRTDGSKAPLLEKGESWTPWQETPAEEKVIRSWYKNEAGGVGVIAGRVSGGLEIIDIENLESARHWSALVIEAGLEQTLNKLLVVKSPRGFHIYYKCDEPGPNKDLARRPATPEELKERPTQKFKKLIETRGEGGYVVAPGSPAECHETGIPYTLHKGEWEQIPRVTMAERELFLDCARSLNEYFVNKEYLEPSIKHENQERPGDLFNERATWAEVLEPLGWRSKTPGRWIRPGGKRDSACEIVNGSRLWVFTTSVTELPFEKALSKFAVYTLLTHNGDWTAAGRALAFKGYCKPAEQTQTNFAPPASEENADEQFDENIPLWPTLPEEALYGIAGEVAREATEKSEADPAAVLATFLVRAGATFGAKAFFNVGETKHYPRLFSIVVGKSSRARKGTSLDPVERIFELAERRATISELNVSPGPLSSGEGLINAVRDAAEPVEDEDDSKKRKQKPDQGVQDKRLLVVEAEFAGALRAMQRQGNNISAIIRTAWDKGNIAPLTRHNPVKTTGAHIAILGHITQQELLTLMEKVEVWNGFANRFLWFCARRSKEVAFPEAMNKDIVSDIATRLATAIQHAQKERTLNFHPEVAEIWKRVYPNLTQEIDGIVGNVTSRAEAQVIRLALVYALLDKDDMIRVPHILAAIAVWQYCLASVKYVFATVGFEESDDLSDRILNALKNGEKTQSELCILFNRNVSAAQLSSTLKSLQSAGRVNQRVGTSTGKGGRKPVYWSLAIGGDVGGA